MELAEQKLNLIERLMQINTRETLAQVEEILIRAEMEARTKQSLEAIDNNETVDLREFKESRQAWIRKNSK